jgi:PIN domain nuclease of toxin-antitoxin system
MNLLLDTHSFIWFVENDSRLPENIKKEIEKPNNNIFVSIASLWEITIKISIGKLTTKAVIDKIIEQVADNGFEIVPILPEHLLTLSKLDFFHRDPFDRLIIAQALCDGYRVVGKDDMFDSYKVKRLWG